MKPLKIKQLIHFLELSAAANLYQQRTIQILRIYFPSLHINPKVRQISFLRSSLTLKNSFVREQVFFENRSLERTFLHLAFINTEENRIKATCVVPT